MCLQATMKQVEIKLWFVDVFLEIQKILSHHAKPSERLVWSQLPSDDDNDPKDST